MVMTIAARRATDIVMLPPSRLLLAIASATLAIVPVLSAVSAPRNGTSGIAADAAAMRARYQRAAAFLPSAIDPQLYGLSVQPQWTDDGTRMRWSVDDAKGTHWYEVAIDSGRISRLAEAPPAPARVAAVPDTLSSPNGRWQVRAEHGNLVRIDLLDGSRLALTRDAEPDYLYAVMPDADTASLTRRLAGKPAQPYGLWSPDGERLLTYRVDERQMFKMPFVVNVTPGAAHQLPFVHYQNTALPDAPIQRAELMVFDMRTGKRTDLAMPAPAIGFSPTPVAGWFWSPDGRTVFAAPETDDYRQMTVYAADASTGAARVVASDRSALTLRPDIATRFQPVGNGEEIIVYSERDDWGHFYLYDAASGEMKRQLTRGNWAVHGLQHVDVQRRLLYFTAGGREPGRNPYYTHFYRVSLDGGEPELLTPEDAQHAIRMSPDGQSFVDTFSTVDSAPVTRLRSADGQLRAELAKADLGALERLGWRPPVRFTVKAADGKTDLHGVMYLPADLDERRKYPIIDSQYSAPHVVVTPRRFVIDTELALAQLGFVVINVDGRATSLRQQSMQDLGFAGKQSAPLLVEDHKAAMEQLARRYPFIDIDRVGVYGHSAGGYRAARAMLQFPDFYKVGVASAGSHDAYVHQSLARYYGRPQEYPDGFGEQPNMPLAGNLKGKLLLVHGDVDDDVHVGVSLQLADALIRQGKDFDMFIYPNRNHKNLWDGYLTRRVWNYFLQHLRDESVPADVVLPDP